MKKIMVVNLLCAALMIAPVLSMSSTTENNAAKPTMMQSTKQVLNDSEITSKVKTELLFNKHIKSYAISVKTVDGAVTLTGKVDNALQKHTALRIASKVTGVKSVKNDLIIAHTK